MEVEDLRLDLGVDLEVDDVLLDLVVNWRVGDVDVDAGGEAMRAFLRIAIGVSSTDVLCWMHC